MQAWMLASTLLWRTRIPGRSNPSCASRVPEDAVPDDFAPPPHAVSASAARTASAAASVCIAGDGDVLLLRIRRLRPWVVCQVPARRESTGSIAAARNDG